MSMRNQKKGQDMRPQDDYDDPEVLEKIENNLQSVDDEPADSTPDDQRRGDEPVEPDDEPADSTPDDSEPDNKEDEVVLPERLIRAAIHQGWEQEDIQEFFQANPEKALKTFERIYESTNKLSKRWAELGRQQSQPKPVQKQQQQQVTVDEPKYKGIDMNKIREEHGNDPLVDIIEQQDKALKSLFNVQKTEPSPTVQQNVQLPQDTFQEDMALWQQLNNFFADPSMNEYSDVYGPGKTEEGNYVDWKMLQPGQYHNRMAMIERAEQILTGAELQGESMSTQEAFNLAHLLITAPIRDQIVRSQIKASVKQRNKGITLKPSNNQQMSTSSAPKTEAELEERTAERLANIKW